MHREAGTPVIDNPDVTATEVPVSEPSLGPPEVIDPRIGDLPIFERRRQSPWLAICILMVAAAAVFLVPLLMPLSGGEWLDLKHQGNARFTAGDFRGAERLYRDALTETDKMGPRGLEAGMVLFNLANDLRAEGRNASAENAMAKSLAAYRADRRSQPKDVYHAITALSSLYMEDAKFEKAIPLLHDALKMDASLPPTDCRGAYADMTDLAIAYRGAHRPAEAETSFKKAVAAAPTNFARDRILAVWHAR
jgi:tetratricopeptide (TPR) repeat protein